MSEDISLWKASPITKEFRKEIENKIDEISALLIEGTYTRGDIEKTAIGYHAAVAKIQALQSVLDYIQTMGEEEDGD